MKNLKPLWKLMLWPQLRAWRERADKVNRHNNAKSRSRQVLRNDLFHSEMAYVNKNFGGEPRSVRRSIARDRAKRAHRAIFQRGA